MTDNTAAKRASQLAHPQTKYTELDKGHWITFRVSYAKFEGRGTTARRSFRTQVAAESFADGLAPACRPHIEKIETTVLRWEEND